MAEKEGFEPSIRCRIHTFQACAFDHSATSPWPRSLAQGSVLRGNTPAKWIQKTQATNKNALTKMVPRVPIIDSGRRITGRLLVVIIR